MATKIMGKRVELTEAFFDLVFAYAISNTTKILADLNQHTNPALTFLFFAIVLIIFLNSWMIETVYTNRYGQNSLTDVIFFMIDMGVLLFMSNTFSGNLQTWFRPFVLSTGVMSLTLAAQYTLVYWRPAQAADRKIARDFLFILGLRAGSLLISAWLPQPAGLILAAVGVLSSWLLPSFFTTDMKQHPIIFSHLLERLTLLVIITFGEMIINIADYFTLKNLTLTSVFVLIIVGSLFMSYLVEFDHLIDSKRAPETGVKLIYLHYPILFGLSLITVSWDFLRSTIINNSFAVFCLYSGIGLLYLGNYLAQSYNRTSFKTPHWLNFTIVGTTLMGCLICISQPQFTIIVSVTMVVVLINVSLAICFLRQRQSFMNKK
ncbi:low temperature requirement protein A [Lapidilactobacillus gannanensis]|uniref:Low temperature requirement protein A n=1 Tax=Lapidilactobacillus gannanensis TaxID=2486002 RepID=A0ABW4BL53_9LACO|nr:low temperature requirement protein A [Lapidilactobacillus gannanensis]